jgi:hypothetical protein
MQRIKPIDFIDCFITNIHIETEQLTLSKILEKIYYIMNNFIMHEDYDKLSAKIFDVLLAKVKITEH